MAESVEFEVTRLSLLSTSSFARVYLMSLFTLLRQILGKNCTQLFSAKIPDSIIIVTWPRRKSSVFGMRPILI